MDKSVWTDINSLFEDMQKFAQDNPDYIFLCADDSGQLNCEPSFGWIAYIISNHGHEDIVEWRINISDFENSSCSIKNERLLQFFRTSKGRKEMLRFITGKFKEDQYKEFNVCVIKNENGEYYSGTSSKSELMFVKFPEHALIYSNDERTKHINNVLNKFYQSENSGAHLKLFKWEIKETVL